jgi:predicted phosphate transport protein (TIGR00153 family)
MRLLPKQVDFYKLFGDQAAHIRKASRLLVKASEGGSQEVARIAAEIKKVEHEADAVIQEVWGKLQKTFVTPIDPEDIHRLASALDDVLDDIEDAAHRLALYRIETIPSPVVSMCRVIDACGEEIQEALATLSKEGAVKDHCMEINRLEDEADRIYREALADLFQTPADPLEVLKLKEVYEYLESAVDRCEDVADVLESIAIKSG